MQRSGAATRRFYAAFYQLTVRSANPTRLCVAGASLVSRRANSTASGTKKKPEGIRRGLQRQIHPMNSFLGTIQTLQNAPVQSAAERPLGSLQAWGHAIRDRSSNSVTVELSVPGWVLRTPDVTQSATTNEVQLRLPDSKNGEGDFDLRPVLLSGDPVDVKAVWKAIHVRGSREAPRQPRWAASQSTGIPNAIPNPRPPPWRYYHKATEGTQFEADFCIPETAWYPLAEHGCIEWFQQEFGVQTDVLGVLDGFTYLRLRSGRFSVVKATDFLQQAKNWTDSQAIERYNFIRHSVDQGLPPSSAPSEAHPFRELAPREPTRGADHPRSETRIRVRRFTVPELLQQKFEDPQSSPMAQIQQDSGIKAIRCRPMAGSRHYLQLLGTDAALERAVPMLEQHLCAGLVDGSGTPVSIDRLHISEQWFQPAEATHFAWIKVPDPPVDMSGIVPEFKRSLRATDCTIEQFRAGGRGDLMLRGTEEAVNLGIIGMQDIMDARRVKLELPAAKLETHKMGLIQDISKETPWEDSGSIESDGSTADAKLQSGPVFRKVMEEFRFVSGLDSKAAGPESAWKVVKQQETKGSPAADGKAVESQVLPELAWKDVKQETRVSPNRVTSSQAGHAAALSDITDRSEDNRQTRRELDDGLISAFRRLTQPVALITSTMPKDSSDIDGMSSPRGVTVSSFCTVTLQPAPIVSFNLRVPSRTWDALAASGHLNIFLLAASPQGAAVAHAFTQPHEQPKQPFQYLETLGAHVKLPSYSNNPPDIFWEDAVYARIRASLMRKSCIRVGDHMIVLARLQTITQNEASMGENHGALAYGMRGYRLPGRQIEPTRNARASRRAEAAKAAAKSIKKKSVDKKSAKGQPAPVAETDGLDESKDLWKGFMDDFMQDLEQDDRSPAETQGSSASTDPAAHQDEQASKELEDIGPSSPIMDEASLWQALAEAEESYSSNGLPSQTAKDNPMLAEALKAASGAYGETPDAATTPTAPTLQNPDTTTRSSSDVPQKKTPNKNSEGARHGKNKPSDRTFFSTWTRSQTRSYSTSNNNNNPDSPASKKILNSTVEDFLCQIPTNNRLYNNLIAAQREAEKLESQLADGAIPAEEIASVTAEAQAIRRRVARELAWRNAQDLRVLLDQGHVSSERAQWLESNLEQGQAILLQEAKLLRKELEEGRLVREGFEGGKAALMRDYEEFEGLLKRLREFVDEDDVSGGEGQQEAGSSGSGRP